MDSFRTQAHMVFTFDDQASLDAFVADFDWGDSRFSNVVTSGLTLTLDYDSRG